MEIVRKISLGSINGVRKGFKDVSSLLFVARIFGVVNSAAVEPTSSGGTQIKFVGEFGAINMERKVYGAPVAFLPAQAEATLHSAVAEFAGKPVKFAFDIFASPDKTPVGYSITVSPLMEPLPMVTLAELALSLPDLPARVEKPADSDKPAEQSVETPAADPAPEPAPEPAAEPPEKPAKPAKSARK